MAKLRGKGTILNSDISGAAVAVAQIISLNIPDMESETYESDTLDNPDAGIPYDVTGRTEGGSMSAEMFFDPGLAGHQALLQVLSAPVDYADTAWNLIFASASPSVTWPFVGAGLGIGGPIVLNDGIKATMTVKLDKIPTFP